MNLWKLFLSALLLVASCFAVDDLDPDDLSNMSLEDLLDIKITVASKRAETVQDAPGVVSLYTAAAINQTGYYSLAELAEITPGYGTVTRLGNTFFETRGQVGDLNAKHLLMIDGIPVNHARDYMAFAQEQVPLLFAKQVEYLRGPASALYGVSAFFGVVNVTGRQLEDAGTEFANRVTLGDSESETGLMGYMLHRNGRHGLHLSYGFYDQDASLAPLTATVPDWVAVPVDQRLRDNQQSRFLNLNYRVHEGKLSGLRAGVIFMAKESGYGESWTGGIDTSEQNEEQRSTFVPYLRYENEVATDWWVNSYLKFNRSLEEGTQKNDIWGSPFFFQFKAQTDDLEYLFEVRRDFNESSSLIVGANYDVRFQDDDESFLFNPADPKADVPFFEGKAKTSSLYAQYNNRFDVGKGMLVTVGARFDRGEIEANSYDQVSPRVAIVQKVTDRLSAKLLIGSALKAPGVKEIGHNTEKTPSLIVAANVPNVGPETIDTQEIAVSYASSHWYGGLTLYRNQTQDLIVEAQLAPELYTGAGDQPGFFQNTSGEIEGEGWELDLKFRPNEAWQWFANVAGADVENDQNQSLVDVPELKANLGISYRRNGNKMPWVGSLILKHVDQYSGPAGVGSYDGQTVLDLHAVLSLSAATDLQFRVTNLGDEDYAQPAGGAAGLPMPGRQVQLSLSARF